MILLLSFETGFCRGSGALGPLVATYIADLYEMKLHLLASCIYNVFLVNWAIIKT
jgi:hypothetical protein